MQIPSSAATQQVQEIFLDRLERLLIILFERQEEMNDLGRDLVEMGILSTYRDCVAFGVGEKAYKIQEKFMVNIGWSVN